MDNIRKSCDVWWDIITGLIMYWVMRCQTSIRPWLQSVPRIHQLRGQLKRSMKTVFFSENGITNTPYYGTNKRITLNSNALFNFQFDKVLSNWTVLGSCSRSTDKSLGQIVLFLKIYYSESYNCRNVSKKDCFSASPMMDIGEYLRYIDQEMFT